MAKSVDEIAVAMQMICSRKAMYFQPVDATTARTFVDGFLTGCFVLGVELDWNRAEQMRGWKTSPLGPIPQMKERGLNDDKIADELLAILSAAVADGRIT